MTRYDEFDEQTDAEIYITKQLVLLKQNKVVLREFSIEEIESMTLSVESPEFILHMFEEYDERLATDDNRSHIIEMLLYLITNRNDSQGSIVESMPIYLVKDINLDMYVTTEEDLEDGHTIRPDDDDMKMLSY